ncbi:transcription factor 7-like 1-B isoform X2 [Syngnathus scovelli]|uniref:transcription factor 7-like 1-B isoform X2 n=1 Tax=Syngnathus scovelli TaxID=161590 RepID=UPI00210F2C44|nr:transcription factor 7-like 1-B isoform X2 [Syngnathus scovelli]
MPQLSDDGDLGANDELIPFKDEGEGEHDDKTTAAAAATAAQRDLDDVKSSLVNESETNHSVSDSEAADRRARRQPDAAGLPGRGQPFGEALRRRAGAGARAGAGGVLQAPAFVGYPFFMIPDLYGSYLAGGGLARAYLPWQWPLLDVAAGAAGRDSGVPAHPSSGAPAFVAHLHPLLSRRPEASSPPSRVPANFSPDAGSSRPPQVARYPVSPAAVAEMAHAFDWLPSPGPVSAVKREPAEAGARSPPRKSPVRDGGAQAKGHIKKPLNAFMLFMRDERPKVVAQCQVKESATINQILGQRWHSLSKDEQAKYYELARKERLLHSQLYPGWSARDNYGKKKKRKKCKSESHQDTAADDFPLRPTHPVPHEAPHELTSGTSAHLLRPYTLSHLTHTHLSQASPASSVDSPATAAALASPAAPAPTFTEHSDARGGRVSPTDQPLALTAHAPRGARAPPAATSDLRTSSTSSYGL